VSIQAQVVNHLRDRFGLSYLFIAHDLAVVKHVADRVTVMHLGRIVEEAPKERLFTDPRHPYTRVLLAATPEPDPHRSRTRQVAGSEVPSPLAVPPGCRFNIRCRMATDICRMEYPAFVDFGGGHRSACHHAAALPPMDVAEAEPPSRPAATRLNLYGRTPARPHRQDVNPGAVWIGESSVNWNRSPWKRTAP